MSLQTAITKLTDLAPKASGHLIRHDDWNALIEVLKEYGLSLTDHDQALDALEDRVAAAETQLATVAAQVQTLDARVDGLEQQIQPLLNNYLVSMSCAKATYALAEFCEITAKVTDLSGKPLPAPFPWVDFVAAWGRLRAKSGFVTRAGAGDNSLSVQVNAQGVAQVVLRSEHSEGFSQVEEEQVNAVVNMQVPQLQMTVAQAVMAAATPTDERAKQAYKVVNLEYESKNSTAMRNYADTYYVRNPQWQVEPAGPSFWNQWRDYRATVLAMAKPDADPETPDGVRGSASIQVTFRDWLWSWGGFYFDDSKDLELQLQGDLAPVFEAADIFAAFEDKFQKSYKERGILGRQKYMNAAKNALDKVQPGTDLRKQAAKEEIHWAIGAQESSELYGGGKSGMEAMVMKAHIGHGKQTEAVQTSVAGIGQQVEETKGIQASVNVLEGRMQAAERVGQTINSSLTLINDNVRAINPLDENSIKANVQKISADIAALKTRMG